MRIFQYGDTETAYLSAKDAALGRAIDTIGPIQREIHPELFAALVHAIIGQQISTKAQVTIWERMMSTVGDITPAAIICQPETALQRFGVTFKKAGYMRSAAEWVLDGRLDIGALQSKSDTEVCANLIQLPGVGVWTAEMLMLFSMQRPDILSFGDLAILRGMRMLYRHKKISRELFEKYRRRYSPYGSTASLYLWAIAGGAIVGLKDPAARVVK